MLEESIGVNVYDLVFSNGILYMIPKAWSTNEKTEELHQNLKSCATKDTIKRVKSRALERLKW